jgi:hypothetical protein
MSTRLKRSAYITSSGALLIFLLVCAGCQVSLNLFYTQDPLASQVAEEDVCSDLAVV